MCFVQRAYIIFMIYLLKHRNCLYQHFYGYCGFNIRNGGQSSRTPSLSFKNNNTNILTVFDSRRQNCRRERREHAGRRRCVYRQQPPGTSVSAVLPSGQLPARRPSVCSKSSSDTTHGTTTLGVCRARKI